MEWFSKIGEFVKLPIRYFFIASLISGSILFLPASALQRMHLEGVVASSGATVGFIFLVSTSVWAVNGVAWLLQRKKARDRRIQIAQAIKEYAENLDAVEASVLREFWLRGQKTMRLPIDHPVVAGLRRHMVLTDVGNHGEASLAGMLFPCKISKLAEAHLTPQTLGFEHCLQDPKSGELRLSEEGELWISRNRPNFIAELDEHENLFHGW